MNPTANSVPSNSPHSSSFSVSVAAVGAEIHDMTLILCEIAPAFDTWSALVDTGAQINLISHSKALLLSTVIRPSTIPSFTGVDGSPSLPNHSRCAHWITRTTRSFLCREMHKQYYPRLPCHPPIRYDN